jgi:large-conductance mechanosensitive channel
MSAVTVYTIAVGFFLGGALKDYFQAVIEQLVTPFAVLLGGVDKSVAGLTVSIGPVKLEVGKVVSATITLAVALVVVAVTLPYIKAYAPMIGARR